MPSATSPPPKIQGPQGPPGLVGPSLMGPWEGSSASCPGTGSASLLISFRSRKQRVIDPAGHNPYFLLSSEGGESAQRRLHFRATKRDVVVVFSYPLSLARAAEITGARPSAPGQSDGLLSAPSRSLRGILPSPIRSQGYTQHQSTKPAISQEDIP